MRLSPLPARLFTLRLARFVVVLAAIAAGSCDCTSGDLPDPPDECDANGIGCLPDEMCVDSKCVPFDKCSGDEDCPTVAYRCTFPAEVCEVRPGFGLECAATTECDPGFFCALGICRDVGEARPCGRRTDCPLGQACDQQSFFCIEEGPCTISDTFPELACESGETCDPTSQRCQLECQEQCTNATAEADCGAGMLCDGACRCVQCLTDADCGQGLVCNVRAGRCESENLCFDDSDCENPLICDPQTALCQIPPPPCEDDLDCGIAEICNRVTGNCELPGGACFDDRFEDADTPAQAEEINVPLDGVALLVDELQLCPDDDDVYALALESGDNLLAEISGTTPLARATVWLLDSAGETSVRFAEAPPYGDGRINYVAQEDETVFLRVNALLGPTPYDMTLQKNPGTPCAPDAYEGEAGNNDIASASVPGSFPLGPAIDATLCPNDVDHYRVSLDAGAGFDVALAFDPTFTDMDIRVFDAESGVLLAQSTGVFQPERLHFRSTGARDVVVQVSGFGNDNGPYNLTLTPLAPLGCEDDAFEPDAFDAEEAIDQAILVPAGDTLSDVARTACAADSDWYRVPLLDFERLVVRADFIAGDLDLDLTVLDATGTIVLKESPNAGDRETVTYEAPAMNTEVLVRIRSRFNTQAPYTLTLFRENQFDCTPDDLEPNDTDDAAVALPEDSPPLSICESDEDYFAVDGVAGKKLVASASFLHSDGDIDLMIIGLNGNQVLASSDGVTNYEQAEAVLPLDGVYFVRVFSLTNGTKARYDLDIDLVTVD